MKPIRKLVAPMALVTAVVAALLGPMTVDAADATATANISGGSRGFVTPPPDVTFNVTLNGADQTATATQPLDVTDATGSAAGWNLTATSTTFTTGGGSPHTLSTTATHINSTPTDACDAGSTGCTLATNSITYPYTLPAGSSPPTATKFFDAAAGTGMGNQTVTPTWSLSVPASTTAGTYTSTWTISLVSGP